MEWRRALRELCLIAGFAVLAVLQTGISSQLGTQLYGGGGGDPGRDTWTLSWITGHLLSPSQLFEGNAYYPSHNAVLFCDPILGPSVLVAPLRLFSSNPVLLYNCAILFGLVLASYGFYRLAYDLVGDHGAAALAGVVIPYTSQQMIRLFHLNLLTIAFFPFLILALLKLFARPRWTWALMAGVSFGLQAGTSGYYAICALFLSLIIAACEWRSLRNPALWGHLLLAAALASAILAPYVIGFSELRSEASMVRDEGVQRHYSIDLPLALFVGHSYVWEPLLGGERGPAFFPGLVVLVFAAIAVVRGRKESRRTLWIATAVVFLGLAAGPVVKSFGFPLGPGPFRLAAALVPFIGAVRHPLTFGVPAMMALGLLAVEGVARSGVTKTAAGTALVLTAAVAEVIHPQPRRYAPPERSAVYDYFTSVAPRAAVLEVPFGARPDPERTMPDDVWRWNSIFHELRLANGAGTFEPDRFITLSQFANHEWKRGEGLDDTRSLEYLKRWFPVRYVVAHRAETPGAVWRALEQTPSLRVVFEAANGDRVYRLSRSGTGVEVWRAFREDQCSEGRIRVVVDPLEAAGIRVGLDDAELQMLPVQGPGARPYVIDVGAHRQRGLHALVLRGVARDGGATPMRLVDLDCGE
jgi:hypothetical protein